MTASSVDADHDIAEMLGLAVILLLPHSLGLDLRRIADPQLKILWLRRARAVRKFNCGKERLFDAREQLQSEDRAFV